MSYVNTSPGYYQMLQPNSVWHPGGPGWSTAPVPGWGENPNLVGPPRLAVSGLGGCSSCSGLGGVKAFSGLGEEPQTAGQTAKMVVLGAVGLGVLLIFVKALSDDTAHRERQAKYRSAAARYRARTTPYRKSTRSR
jgi:hypothetical protein